MNISPCNCSKPISIRFGQIFHRDLLWPSYLTKKLVQGHSYPQASTEVWPIQIGPRWGKIWPNCQIVCRFYMRLMTMTFDPRNLVQGFCTPFTWRHFRWSMGQIWPKGENTCIVQTRTLNIGLLQKVAVWIDKRMDRCKLSTLGYLQSKAQINLYSHPLYQCSCESQLHN